MITERRRTELDGDATMRRVRGLAAALLSLGATVGMDGEGFEMTAAERLVVLHLRWRGACGASELARATGLSSGAVTILVSRLEGRGLLVREAHPHDRRRVLVYPSKRCEARLRELERDAVDRLEEVAVRRAEDGEDVPALLEELTEALLRGLDPRV